MRIASKGRSDGDPPGPSLDDYPENLTLEDFARHLGTTTDRIPDACSRLIAETDFRYRKLIGAERDQVVLDVLKRIDSGPLPVAGKDRKGRWEMGWSENLESFLREDGDLSQLVPKYVRPNQVVRLGREYVRPLNPQFELAFYSVLRLWLFSEYLAEAESVYEFGCGSAYNLVALAKLFPEKRLHGLDWAVSSVRLVDAIAEVHHLNMRGRQFDFFAPDPSLQLTAPCAVVTMCALEQVGAQFEPFLQFLLQKSPGLCLNLEPIYELYDENHLVDYLAMCFHKQRGYLSGYLTRLRQLEAEKRIEILKTHRTKFGSLFHEGYSFVVWRPR